MKMSKRILGIWLAVAMLLTPLGFPEGPEGAVAEPVVEEIAEPAPEPEAEIEAEIESIEEPQPEAAPEQGSDISDMGEGEAHGPEAEDSPGGQEAIPAERLAAELGVTAAELARLMGAREEELLSLDEESLANLCADARARGMVVSDLLIDVEGALIGYRGEQAELAVPEGVREIADEALRGNARLIAVKLPASVRRVGKRAFEGCANLEKVTIKIPEPGADEGLREIGERAFASCGKLAEIALPETLESVGDEAFRDCAALHIFELPGSASSVGRDIFAGCAEPEEEAPLLMEVFPETEPIDEGEALPPEAEEAWPLLMMSASLAMPEALTLGVGESETLPLDFEPAFDGDALTIQSDDAAIATASKVTDKATGKISVKITGKSADATVIHVSTTSGAFAECAVTVTLVPPTAIVLSATKLTLGKGDTAQLSVKEFVPEGSGAEVTYTSGNEGVATVDPETGLVTAVKTGSATITAKTDNGKTAKCTVTVKAAPTSVKLNKKELKLSVGEKPSEKLTVTLSKNSASTLKWESSEPGVATVDPDGTVTAVGAGEAIITVATHNYDPEKPDDAKNAKLIVTCAVTVAPDPASISGLPEKVALGKGETLTLAPVAKDAEGEDTYAEFSYISSDAAVAFVDAKGKVTAKKLSEGPVTIAVQTNNGTTATVEVEVQPAPVKADLTLSASSRELGIGESFELTATLAVGKASKLTATSSNANIAAVKEVEPGRFLITTEAGKQKTGTATITVKTFNGVNKTCKVTVKKAPTDAEGMLKIAIKPETARLAEGQTATLKATYKKDFGGGCSWNVISGEDGGEATFDETVDGTVDVTTKEVTLTAVKAGTVTVTATSYNGLATATCPVTIEAGPAVVTLNESEATLGVKETLQLTPTAVDDQGRPVTLATYTYAVTNDEPKGCVTVDDKKGKITAKAEGTATVTATAENGASAQCMVTVKAAPTSVTITNIPKTLGIGEEWTLEAKISATKNKQEIPCAGAVTFTSSAPSVLAVDKDTGALTAKAAGKSAKITAKAFNGKSASVTIAVKKEPTAAEDMLTIKPAELTLAEGQKATLTASYKSGFGGGYSWNVIGGEDGGVATIENGVLTAVKAGTVTVTATSYNGAAVGRREVTIEPAPQTVELEESIELGLKETLTLMPVAKDGETTVTKATFTYESDDLSVVSVDKKTGKMTAKKTGTATVTVESYNGKTAECTVTVKNAPGKVTLTPAKATLGSGEEFEFVAALPDGTASRLTVTTNKAAVATVVQTEPGKFKVTAGEVAAGKTGTATITVKTFNGKSAKFTVTVKPAPTEIRIDEAVQLGVGQTFALKPEFAPTGADCAEKYTSGSEDVVTVTDAGVLTAVGTGHTTVRVETYNGHSDVCEVTVYAAPTKLEITNPVEKLGVKEKYQLHVVCDSDASLLQYCTWKSSNAAVLAVDAKTGLLTAKKTGKAKITATMAALPGQPTAKIEVSVASAPSKVTLSPASVTLRRRETVQLTATLPKNTASQIRWMSSDNTIATVTDDGLVTAVSRGTATITATAFNDKKGICEVTVEGPAAPTIRINGEIAGAETVEVNGSVTVDWSCADEVLHGYDVRIEAEDGAEQLRELKGTQELRVQLPRAELKSGSRYRVEVSATVMDIDEEVLVSREVSFIYIDLSAYYSWENVDGGVRITGYSSQGGSVRVPAELGDLPVVCIGTGAFNAANCPNCAQITSISWPAGVAFEEDSVAGLKGCADAKGFLVFDGILCEYFGSATSVTIPADVTRINDGAFDGKTKLASVRIPDGVQTIGVRAFANCTALKSMTTY